MKFRCVVSSTTGFTTIPSVLRRNTGAVSPSGPTQRTLVGHGVEGFVVKKKSTIARIDPSRTEKHLSGSCRRNRQRRAQHFGWRYGSIRRGTRVREIFFGAVERKAEGIVLLQRQQQQQQQDDGGDDDDDNGVHRIPQTVHDDGCEETPEPFLHLV